MGVLPHHHRPTLLGTFYVQAVLLFIIFGATAAELSGNSLSEDFSLLSRYRRATVSQTVSVTNGVYENVANDVMLYNMTTSYPGRTYTVTGNSANKAGMFEVLNGRLQLARTLPATDRALFDYEKYKTFDVIVRAVNVSDSNDIVIVTVKLTLLDVNDEMPVFTNEIQPFRAKLAALPQVNTQVFTVTASDPDTTANLQFDITSIIPSQSPARFVKDTRPSQTNQFTIVTADSTSNDPYTGTYTIRFYVQDMNSETGPQRIEGELQVTVGDLPPQFYRPSYVGSIYENLGSNFERKWVMTETNDELQIKVKQYQTGNSLNFQLLDRNLQTSSRFEIVPDGLNAGVYKIRNRVNIDYETIQEADLVIKVTESGTSLSSTASITIKVVDENDHAPAFVRSQYSNSEVPEDVKPGDTVLTVQATDDDSGLNGELVFTLTDYTFFNITTTLGANGIYNGNLMVKTPLDYDNPPGPKYEATVIVSDKGTQPLSASMVVRVEVRNVNDNSPVFVNGSREIDLIETSTNGHYVTRIQATDIDGDTVKYYFQGKAPSFEIFSISADEGVIRLSTAPIPANRDSYSLTVIAVDDDNCCRGYPRQQRTSSATYTINIVGVNANKPKFIQCSSYDVNARVKEKSVVGTQVVQVSASDEDRGENGRVIYRIESPNPAQFGAPFRINETTGNITVAGNIIRDNKGYIQVTVVGRNPGDFPKMEGWCTFRVSIIDINDNPPIFAQAQYNAAISITARPVVGVIQMQATDADVGVNANITYSLIGSSNVTQMFNIDAFSGFISLVGNLKPDVASYQLTVLANDNGKDPGPLNGTTRVLIEVNFENKSPPQWVEYPNPAEYRVKESASTGLVLGTWRCQSNSDEQEVEYRVFDPTKGIASDSTTFGPTRFMSSGQLKMNLTLIGRLSFLDKKEYSITVACQSLGSVALVAQIPVKVYIEDANNQPPVFQGLDSATGRIQGRIAEDAPAGSVVTRVSATDDDEVLAYRTVTFELVGDAKLNFTITDLGNNNAEVKTSPNLRLDRETQSFYQVEIIAKDGAPADPPKPGANASAPNTASRYIDIVVTDVNDNPPVFEKTKYNHSISENANINELVFTVTATDPDENDMGLGLDYHFTSGNINNAFNILSVTGEIRVARKLDYDANTPTDPNFYRMVLVATDSDARHSATTTVEISILDENDNPPIFNPSEYRVENKVTEENPNITQSNPFFLVQVKATDADTSRAQTNIRYFIVDDSGQPGPNQLFTIDRSSGNVSLVGMLDREAGPTPEYKITVRAEDEITDPLIAYADVVIVPIDINDNYPIFNQQFLRGSVNEHSIGADVVTLIATDKDGGDNGRVSYRIFSPQPTPDRSGSFDVLESGLIRTKGDPSLLDRENTQYMELKVAAYDHGNPALTSTATVTITLLDINDQSPYFEQPLYKASLSEFLTSGVFMQVQARDKDSDPKNREFRFELRGNNSQTSHFDVATNGDFADISVINAVDYEKDPHLFRFQLYVSDGEVGHENTTIIEITITDYNDNAPVFDQDLIRITLVEEQDAGQAIANFSATDADSGINAEFEFSVVRSSDPRYEFYIHPHTGVVTTRKKLDRETEAEITVIFMAKDKGEIPLNSTARLIITLTDINDNAPSFAEDYKPVVYENEDNSQGLVVQVIRATDPDTPKYGPPFGMKLPPANNCTIAYDKGCNEGIICPPSVAHQDGKTSQAGDGGNGEATIRTTSTFDREERKYYYLPIIMWDMANSPGTGRTTTNTLTITIGDRNDNPMKPGHQDIHVYNYEGQFGDIEIGRVYVEDPDDWDLPDKTFTFSSPSNMENYFSVDSNTGTIIMKENVPPSRKGAPYDFKVLVEDQKYGSVTSTVSVVVELLTDEAVRKSGGVRLEGITAEEFVKTSGSPPTSDYTKFRQSVANLLGYPSLDNIDIVSLTDGPGYLDVRFAGHASPYLNPSQLESAIMLNMNQFQRDTGLTVDQVPINLCMDELYDDGCYSFLNVTGNPGVTNANGTAVVGMETTLSAQSGCIDGMFPEPQKCRGDYCYNGGTCIEDDWGKLSCECSAGFDGPRCQQRRHRFDGSSAAFYKGLSVCSGGRTSIDFITEMENGLIMFSGPITAIDPNNDPQDYLILELKNGYPYLRINLGSGELSLQMNGNNQQGTNIMKKLNDGKWHHLDIDRNNQDVTLTVDSCEVAVANNNGTVPDWSPCRISGNTGGPDVLLNVQSLLQLGGRYPAGTPPSFPSGVTTSGFSGCMKNLVHNTKLYDLHYKKLPSWNSGENGCPREESICGEATDPVCGQRAMCESEWSPSEKVSRCQCHPGWYGDKCVQETPTRDFKDRSYLKWRLGQNLVTSTRREVSIQMMFRTRQATGVLFALTNVESRTIVLKLVNGKLSVAYNMGSGERTLTLNNANANTGTWHLVRLERHGNEFMLSMDGGEGRNYNYQQTVTTLPVIFEVEPYVSAGDRVPATAEAATQTFEDLKNTCIQDVRYNDLWLPLDSSQNGDADPLVQLYQQAGVVNECNRNDCATLTCPPDRVCYPLWEDAECRCLPGSIESASGVCISSCESSPCLNGGTCSIENGQVVCACLADWTGPFCGVLAIVETDEAGLHPGIIAAIVIGILLLLILVILLLVFCRRRDKGEKKMLVEVDPDDDFIRENVMFYDEEGAGEEDHAAYDITLLQRPGRETGVRPRLPEKEDEMRRKNAPRTQLDGPAGDQPNVGKFINDRMNDMDGDDPDADSTREFNFEGGNSDAGSLSSLASGTSDGSQDYDYLSDWGPKFAKLADMYGAGQNLES